LSLGAFAADDTDPPVETFYQRVDIQRYPRFAVGSMNVRQEIHYQIDSSFELFPPDEQGEREAVQTILETTLVKADPLSRAVFTQSLAELTGRKYVYQLNKFSEVVSMTGHRDNTKTVKVQQPDSKGVLVSSVIDEDGWKELAQLTLFQPPPDARRSRSFVRKTTHDWGSLGSWYGKTNFAGRKFGRDARRFSYQHQLEYIAPNNAAKANNNLPFQIDNARFRTQQARGEIHYHEKQQRVTNVREVFHALGTVGTTMLGVPATVNVEEKQMFTITVTGQRAMKANDDPGR
jgi:hypothetical protein